MEGGIDFIGSIVGIKVGKIGIAVSIIIFEEHAPRMTADVASVVTLINSRRDICFKASIWCSPILLRYKFLINIDQCKLDLSIGFGSSTKHPTELISERLIRNPKS
jgi:hypothetical protein